MTPKPTPEQHLRKHIIWAHGKVAPLDYCLGARRDQAQHQGDRVMNTDEKPREMLEGEIEALQLEIEWLRNEIKFLRERLDAVVAHIPAFVDG
jgi:hypothetical protein